MGSSPHAPSKTACPTRDSCKETFIPSGQMEFGRRSLAKAVPSRVLPVEERTPQDEQEDREDRGNLPVSWHLPWGRVLFVKQKNSSRYTCQLGFRNTRNPPPLCCASDGSNIFFGRDTTHTVNNKFRPFRLPRPAASHDSSQPHRSLRRQPIWTALVLII